MKIKKAIKKIVALGAGATMVGATLLGAMATDLSDYPAPFVQDGSINNAMIVVGANAATSDVIGAIDISASLQAAAYSEEQVSTGTTTVEGGATEDLKFDQDLTTVSSDLDDSDVTGLIDGTITFDSEDIDVSEHILLTSGAVMSTNTGNGDNDFGGNAYVEFGVGSVEYRYKFDEAIAIANIADNTGDNNDTVKTSFLGYELEVITVTNAASDTMKYKASEEHYMSSGSSVTVNGKVVTLLNVGDSQVVVDVDGTSDVVSSATTETINGLEVYADSLFNDDGTANDYANLKIGEDIEKTITDGDAFELFTDYDDDNDAPWKWVVSTDGTNFDHFGITLQNAITNIEVGDEDADEELDPLAMGECLTLPNAYAELCFDSMKEENYVTYTFDFASVSLGGTSYDTLHIHSSSDEGLTIGSEETDDIWIYENGTSNYIVWYDDKDDGKTLSGQEVFSASSTWFNLTADDSTYGAVFTNSTGGDADEGGMAWLNLIEASSDGNNEEFFFEINSGWTYFGDTEGDSDADSFKYNSSGGTYALSTNYAGLDYDLLSEYGVKVTDIEDELNSDKITMKVPEDRQKATIIVKASGTTISGDGATSQSINWVGLGLGALDSDASADSGNLIVVGGPCANSVAAELMGSTSDNCAEGFSEGQAKIKLYDTGDNMALLVAGYSATDTRAASQAVANYASEDFSGDELAVTVLSATDYSLGAPAAEEEEAEADATEGE